MRGTTFLISILFSFTAATAQSPCDWFDHDGDGNIGGNTFLYALGNYGVVGGPMDPDSSGVQDLSDLLSFLPYFGNSCDNLDWYDTTTGHIIDLAVVEYAVHTEDLMGLGGTLPAGSVTYHVYALLEDPNDYLLAVFGDADRPLVLETADAFYGFGNDLGETVVVSDHQPLFNSTFPANEFTSWFDAGIAADANSTATISYVAGFANWADSLDPGSIVMDDSIGGVLPHFSRTDFEQRRRAHRSVYCNRSVLLQRDHQPPRQNRPRRRHRGHRICRGPRLLQRRPHCFRVHGRRGDQLRSGGHVAIGWRLPVPGRF